MLIIISILSLLVSPFLVQIVVLNKNDNKTNQFVRFHAYQSIFLQLVNYGIQLLGLGLMLLTSKPSNPVFPSSGAQVVSMSTPPMQEFFGILNVGLTISVWIISIVMAFKAYKLELFKLPVIGDWAMKHANKKGQSFQATESNDTMPEFVPESMKGFQAKTSSDSASEEISPTDKIAMSIIGAGSLLIVIIVIWAFSSSNDVASNNANSSVNTGANGAVTNASANAMKPATNSMSNATNSAANTAYSSTSSGVAGMTGKLTTNMNLRSAANRTATSVGIHFKDAQFRVLEETSFDTPDGYSTWYRVHIFNYGCDANGQLGCGKNNPNDDDDGWLNAKYVILD